MKNIVLDDLIKILKEYNPEEIEIVKRAYDYASDLHQGQYRQSGEPYISHPLNVAYILSELHADRDTVCAGLLHDTLEDTRITKEDIAHDFNQNIANLEIYNKYEIRKKGIKDYLFDFMIIFQNMEIV